jgi:hypothetical protein
MDAKIAYCGIYCGACGIYLATQAGKLGPIAEQSGIPVEYQGCDGCRTEKNNLCCANCSIKRCCQHKNIDSCSECDEFPCSVLEAFDKDEWPHHSGIIDSLKVISESGEAKLLELQKRRWSCPECKTSFHWYQDTCESCGKKVKGFKLPAD